MNPVNRKQSISVKAQETRAALSLIPRSPQAGGELHQHCALHAERSGEAKSTQDSTGGWPWQREKGLQSL